MNVNGLEEEMGEASEPDVDALAKEVVGAAMRVMNGLGVGLPEKHYENALRIELEESGHRLSQQMRFEVMYRGRTVGTLIPDLIVDDVLIVDPKVVEQIGRSEIAQMLTYLSITGLPLALLINFKPARITWRIVHPPRR